MTLLDIKKFADAAINSSVTKTIGNIFQYIILLIIGTVLLYPQVVYENFSKYQEKKHASAIERRLEMDPAIRSILNDVYSEIDADRTYVCEFHNGTNNLAGLPFLYLDMRYEVVAIGTEHVDDEYINFNLTRYQFVPYAIERGYWSGSISEVELIDDRFANNLKRDDAEYVAFILIHGTENLIGVLGVTYTDSMRYGISEDKIKRVLEKNSQKLAVLLSDK